VSGNHNALVQVSVDLMRSSELMPVAVFLVLVRRLGLGAIEESAWRRFREFRLAGLGDALCGEIYVRGVDRSAFGPKVLQQFRPHRALRPFEMSMLLSCHAEGSRRRLANLLGCDRKTVKRKLSMMTSSEQTARGKVTRRCSHCGKD
jgi:hypothetical protein